MKRRSLAVVVSSFLAIGCASADDGSPVEERVGETQDEIVAGTVLNAEGTFYVDVHHVSPTLSGGQPFRRCSGTLIRNDVVLTARHCATTDDKPYGSLHTDLSKYELVIGSQTSGVREIIDVTSGPTNPSDVVLLIAERFFAQNGSSVGWTLPIYAGNSAALIGTPLYCAGYGLSTFGGSFEVTSTLRYAWLTPTFANENYIHYPQNASGQYLWRGDSGGSCMFTGIVAGTTLAVTGVNSSCSEFGPPCDAVAPEKFRTQVAGALFARARSALHVVTTANRSGHYSWIHHPDANNQPNALLTVTPNWNPPGVSGGYNNAPIGVWYDGSRWNVFNEVYVSMAANRAFNISVGGTGFVHQATASNTIFHITTIDHPSLNGNPSAAFQVTQNWNPGGVGGTYNPHVVGVWYDSTVARWTIYNEDLANMPIGASFNVRTDNSKVVLATSSMLSGNTLFLDDPNLNGRPEARVFVTHNYGPGQLRLASPLGVWFHAGTGRWGIFRQDLAAMPLGMAFNVLIRP